MNREDWIADAIKRFYEDNPREGEISNVIMPAHHADWLVRVARQTRIVAEDDTWTGRDAIRQLLQEVLEDR